MAKKKKKRVKLDTLRSFAPMVMGVAVIGLLILAHTTPAAPTALQPQTIPATKTTPTPHSPPPKTAAIAGATTPSTIPAPPKGTPSPATRASAPASAKVEPVVTPSPSSNVSGLAPVTPATAPSTAGTGSSSSQSAPATTTGYTSTNWSGYLAANGNFTAISGTWVAPNVTGTGTSADSTWIGIGGVSASDLIQVGTQDLIASNGQVSTAAFYELLPSTSQTIPGMTVTPGDSLAASLSEIASGQWSITITDQTDHQSFTTTVAYTSTHSSAEWIEEDPSFSFHRQIPFDNFQTVTFTSGATTLSGALDTIANSGAQPVTMLDRSGQAIATPSALTGDGSNFTVTRN